MKSQKSTGKRSVPVTDGLTGNFGGSGEAHSPAVGGEAVSAALG